MSRSLIWSLTLVLTGAAGFAAGRSTAPARNQDEVLNALKEQTARMDALALRMASGGGRCAVAAPLDPAAVRAEVARAVREELAPSPDKPVRPRDEAREEKPSPSPESLAAAEQAGRLLDTALQRKQWGEEQAQEFRRLMIPLDDEQRRALLIRITTALNSGQLEVTTRGRPF
ncbi:MAG TPA: hypothetical protein VK447_06645 [Myxococcaceae bacterium]|nr:hypothetical protein [Myxococcaceae bacterium]